MRSIPELLTNADVTSRHRTQEVVGYIDCTTRISLIITTVSLYLDRPQDRGSDWPNSIQEYSCVKTWKALYTLQISVYVLEILCERWIWCRCKR